MDSRNIKKQKNDILRIVSEMPLEFYELSGKARKDMESFTQTLKVTKEELKKLKIIGVQKSNIINTLRDTFGLSE